MLENLKKYEGVIQGIAGLSLLVVVALWVIAKYEESNKKKEVPNG